MPAAIDVPPGISADAVTDWMAANIDGVTPPLRFEIIVGGHSNLTYSVWDAAGSHYVLRRPPLGAVLATAHDMGREHKIISAVGPTSVPVPPALGMCDDESVNDAPFYIMGFVEGTVIDSAEVAASALPQAQQRWRLGQSVVTVLADLHTIDVDAIGLGDLARKEAYLDRQLKRWRKQWENSKTRELPAMESVYDLLVAAKPDQKYTGIVHGDYRIGNMIIGADATVAAVLDWELCTLGDTLADVGYVMNNWVQPGEPGDEPPAAAPTTVGGFQSREELVAAYSERTGFDVGDVSYYQAFQYWRLAAIVEGVKARYLNGVMVDDSVDTDAYEIRVNELAAAAMDLFE